MVRTADGSIFVFGSNHDAKLGLGSNDSIKEASPVILPEIENDPLASIYAGYNFSMGISKDGNLYAWGGNDSNQLGSEDSIISEPTPVELPSKVVTVACGGSHTVTLSTDLHTVYTFGQNGTGQLGIGPTDYHFTHVAQVLHFDEPVAAIACGCDHSMATLVTGATYIWGCGNSYQLGDGSKANVTRPKLLNMDYFGAVPLVIVPGNCHTLAYLPDSRSVYGWGFNNAGEVTGPNNKIKVPTKIEFDVPIYGLITGNDYGIAITGEGKVLTWGGTDRTRTPILVPDLIVQIPFIIKYVRKYFPTFLLLWWTLHRS